MLDGYELGCQIADEFFFPFFPISGSHLVWLTQEYYAYR